MKWADMIFDVGFLLLGIAAMVIVLVKRKHFDLWLSLLACSAWVVKGVRFLYFDWTLLAIEAMRNAGQVNDIFTFMQIVHLILTGIDGLVNLLLFAALGRLVLLGLFHRWYRKAVKSLNI